MPARTDDDAAVAAILKKRASVSAKAREIPTLQSYSANPALMGLHKANPSQIIAGLTGRASGAAIGKDMTPTSVISGCSAPATYSHMTAKQCECWVAGADLLVTEAEQLMNAHNLADMDAVYAHIDQHALAYTQAALAAANDAPQRRPSADSVPKRERRPSRDYVQDVGVMNFGGLAELEKLRRGRAASGDDAPGDPVARKSGDEAPARQRRPSADYVKNVSAMSFSLDELERLRQRSADAQNAEEEAAIEAAIAAAGQGLGGRRSRSASASGDGAAPAKPLPQDPARDVSMMNFSVGELEKLRIQREKIVNDQ